ncbi:hypothetical protein SAMN05216298_4195 [Glycomyces sambucus]|uniref:TROVE domain-containing protein n=1 Tax=Glycomyces sambucus TaxID=380244 RepID=A0A1G9KQF8_9ACTN|nr:hypothetical protein [Glycomyces sambucus]SDL51879.1 hypothetical protein SAMN05216298_4195 [Glycomyces sambucus]
MESVADLVAAEDVLLFVNAAVAATGQDEFHTGRARQEWSVDFLHEYMLVNYRDLYAAALALGINDRNKARIVLRLLQSGADATPEQRRTEGRLIRRVLRELPVNRVYRLFTALAKAKVNNRRTRAVMREWLTARPDLGFEAVKYRGAFKRAALHAHLDLDGLPGDAGAELASFLFAPMATGRYRVPLFETWRRAHFDRSAVFELPYTVAEGFSAERGIPRQVFLEQIAPNLTRNERLRLQRSGGTAVALDAAALGRMPLTRLAAYVLAIPTEEREERREELTGALRAAALRAAGDRARTWGKVAAVLDDSYSSSGSNEKRRRPLVVALGAHFLLDALAGEYRPLWLSGNEDALLAEPRGVTALGDRILDALETRPDTLVVVSDGWDNAPTGLAAEVLRVWATRLDPERRTAIVHLNPVFDADGIGVRRLAPSVPTAGVRDAEDLPELMAFARFDDGRAGIEELRAAVDARVERWLEEEPWAA